MVEEGREEVQHDLTYDVIILLTTIMTVQIVVIKVDIHVMTIVTVTMTTILKTCKVARGLVERVVKKRR